MRINKAIETGAFFDNEVLLGAIRTAAHERRTLHLWGLTSDGSVHSHIEHLLAFLEMAARESLKNVAVHAVLDGRDKPPRSALPFIDQLEAKLRELRCGRIATVSDVTTRWIVTNDGSGLSEPGVRWYQRRGSPRPRRAQRSNTPTRTTTATSSSLHASSGIRYRCVMATRSSALISALIAPAN